MARTFRDSYRDAVRQQGRSGVLRLWSIVLYDLGVSLFNEHYTACKEWLKQLLSIEERHGKTYMSATHIVFAQRTDIGLQRQSNEDSVISILPEDQQVMASKGVLFVVADVLGGHAGGEVASQLAVNTIRDLYYQQESDDLATSLRLAMEQVNARIYDMNIAESPQAEPDKMMGTTCVAAVVQGVRASCSFSTRMCVDVDLCRRFRGLGGMSVSATSYLKRRAPGRFGPQTPNDETLCLHA
jgi:protein phosphatase